MKIIGKNIKRKPLVDLVEQARQQRIASEHLAEEARKRAEEARELERKVRLARGTRQEIRRVPAPVPAPRASRYFVGDNGPTEQLMQVVSEMLQERPWTFRDILDQTGARDNRIKGVIMRLQRDGVKVANLGEENKALWFIPDQEVLRRLRSAARSQRA